MTDLDNHRHSHENGGEVYPLNLLTGTELFMQLAEQKFWQIPAEAVNCPMCLEDLATLREMRRTIIREEVKEYLDAEEANDWVEMADGLLDIVVVAWGALLAYFGPELTEEMAREVFNSNLSKVDGTLGPKQIREDGKILKPEGWRPPDIEGVLRRAGYELKAIES